VTGEKNAGPCPKGKVKPSPGGHRPGPYASGHRTDSSAPGTIRDAERAASRRINVRSRGARSILASSRTSRSISALDLIDHHQVVEGHESGRVGLGGGPVLLAVEVRLSIRDNVTFDVRLGDNRSSAGHRR
jgi:hypothetical protein